MTASETDILLQADGIDIGYGRVDVIRGASLTVKRGQIIAIIGRSGELIGAIAMIRSRGASPALSAIHVATKSVGVSRPSSTRTPRPAGSA